MTDEELRAIRDDPKKLNLYLFDRETLSPKDAKRIGAMWGRFGKREGAVCRDCAFFRPAQGGFSKCRLFGVSRGPATDWNGKFIACGRFEGKP